MKIDTICGERSLTLRVMDRTPVPLMPNEDELVGMFQSVMWLWLSHLPKRATVGVRRHAELDRDYEFDTANHVMSVGGRYFYLDEGVGGGVIDVRDEDVPLVSDYKHVEYGFDWKTHQFYTR